MKMRAVRGPDPRVPVRLTVATRPAISQCVSVNISASGLGLLASPDGNEPPPHRGDALELAFQLPDGAGVRTQATIMWAYPYIHGGVGRPGWALGVRFDGLSRAAESAIRAYVESHRTRVAVALASDAQAAVVRETLARGYRLLIARSLEAAKSLGQRGDLAAFLVFGQEREAAALLESPGPAAAAGGEAAAFRAERARVVCCAPVAAPRLLELFNAGVVFRWLPIPVTAEGLARAVAEACADYRLAVERDHVALALADSILGAESPPVTTAKRSPEAGKGTPGVVAATFALDGGPVGREPAPEGTPPSTGSAPAPPASSPPPVVMLGAPAADFQRYKNLEPVGEGGMGVVVAAQDTRLSRRVAIKVLHDRHLSRADLVRAMERESRVVGSLEHPNILPVYDAGRTPNGAPFYAMRLIKEPSLAALIDRLRAEPALEAGELGLGRLLRLFTQVCRTVDYAHSRGVIHCDLKPDNVLVGSFGEVLVVDWGLAFVRDEGTVFRGGSFGYVAPEQMAVGKALDARTDVYALGGILYELLCLEPPFPNEADYLAADHSAWGAGGSPAGAHRGGAWGPSEGPHQKKVRHPGRLPPRPRQVAPHRSFAPELEEIALGALAVEPAGRFPSAGALAAAVDEFLEGTKERERRQKHADDLVANADELAGNYFELLSARPDRVAELAAVRAGVAPWDPPERKRALWDAEDGLAVTDSLTVRTLQAAVAAYEQALDEVRDHAGARRGLARLFASEVKRAEERRDEHDRVYFQGLVDQYDDGSITETARGGGTLSVEAAGGGAEVEVAKLEEKDRRLVALATSALGPLPIVDVPLAQGSYLVTLHAASRANPTAFPFPDSRARAQRGTPTASPFPTSNRVLRFPILVKARAAIRIKTDLSALGPEPPGEVLVPGGVALLGGAEGGGDLRVAHVPAFYIQDRPVLFREYLEFVADVHRQLGDTALDLFPRHGQGAPFWVLEGDAFVPGEIAQWGRDAEELLGLPVFGVDVRCAEAYADWKARRTGRPYRLPTEDEWEKAARGTDGRLYPWGNQFDASFCCMRASSPGAPRPRAPGSFAADISPFGVRDLAGGVADWVIPGRTAGRDSQETISRGGAWCDWRGDCLLATRRPYLATERTARVGFRLVCPGPESTAYTLDGESTG